MSEIIKIAIVDLRVNDKNVPVLKTGIFKKEIEKHLNDSKTNYINTFLVTENNNPNNLFLVEKLSDTDNKLPNHSIYGTFTFYKDKMKTLKDNEGYINVSIMPKFSNENDNSLNNNEYVAFQTEGKAEEKKTVYVGNGKMYKQNSLGLAFKNVTETGDFVNCILNRNKVILNPNEENKDLLIGFKKVSKEEKDFFIAYPTNKEDKNALSIISVDVNKLKELQADEKGDFKISVSLKKDESIKKDEANLNVYISRKEGEEKKDTVFIGKGWNNGLIDKKKVIV